MLSQNGPDERREHCTLDNLGLQGPGTGHLDILDRVHRNGGCQHHYWICAAGYHANVLHRWSRAAYNTAGMRPALGLFEQTSRKVAESSESRRQEGQSTKELDQQAALLIYPFDRHIWIFTLRLCFLMVIIVNRALCSYRLLHLLQNWQQIFVSCFRFPRKRSLQEYPDSVQVRGLEVK